MRISQGPGQKRDRRYPFDAFWAMQFMALLVRGASVRMKGDWPEDTQFVYWTAETWNDRYWLIVESDSFDPVEEGAVIPEGPPIAFEELEGV